MKLSALFLLLLSFNISAINTDTESAKLWLEKLSQSLRELNFTTSFVVVKNNQVEPYHWLHGLGDDNIELEIFARMNGPRRDVLRQGEVVSYIEPEQEPYSVFSKDVRSPIPSIFRGDITELEQNYRFISVGRSRILGRVAQLIRIVAKDDYRFSYWLWLDQQSGLLLKMAVLTRKGQLLEQIQFTRIDVTEKLSDNLAQLQLTDLPAVAKSNERQKNTKLPWQVNWLPDGFNMVKSNQHSLNSFSQAGEKAVDFMMFSDGLVEVSVYINASKEKFRAPEYANDGATMVYNHVTQGIEVGVVGGIPLITARKIAESIGLASTKSSAKTAKKMAKE